MEQVDREAVIAQPPGERALVVEFLAKQHDQAQANPDTKKRLPTT